MEADRLGVIRKVMDLLEGLDMGECPHAPSIVMHVASWVAGDGAPSRYVVAVVGHARLGRWTPPSWAWGLAAEYGCGGVRAQLFFRNGALLVVLRHRLRTFAVFLLPREGG